MLWVGVEDENRKYEGVWCCLGSKCGEDSLEMRRRFRRKVKREE